MLPVNNILEVLPGIVFVGPTLLVYLCWPYQERTSRSKVLNQFVFMSICDFQIHVI